MSSGKTYEMLWDCRYCGQKKNLGLSHRHCPSCGAPQDVSARYFPPDDERVAVEDHAFTGADLNCPSCGDSCSARVKFCPHCGSPVEGAAAVARRSDVVHADGHAFAGEVAGHARAERAALQAPVRPPPRKKWPYVLAAAGLVVVSLVLVLVFWTKEVGLAVRSQAWVREIAVERFQEVSESAFCDSVPAGGTVTGRSQKQRGTRQVPDGETCQMRKVDNGDGTFSERRECEPKYRDEPVMDDHCRYRIDKWVETRKERKSGGLDTPPVWPAVSLARTGQCLGCERQGVRSETFRVTFADVKSGEEASCDFEETRWRQFRPGSHWLGGKRLTGGLACDGLKEQQ